MPLSEISRKKTKDERDMMKRSGNAKSNDPLVIVFYELLRSHVHPNVLERIVCALKEAQSVEFVNGWLAQYAMDLSARVGSRYPMPAEPEVTLSLGVEAIRLERRRQLEEGYTSAHDDSHTEEEIAWAATCFAAPSPVKRQKMDDNGNLIFSDPWPGDWDMDKPMNRVQQLVEAGALIAAEIDRLHRLTKHEK